MRSVVAVTDDDTLTATERVRQRWAAFQLDLKPAEADGVWTGQCPTHRREATVLVEEGAGLDDPVTIGPCPAGCLPDEIAQILDLAGYAEAPKRWQRIKASIDARRFGGPDGGSQFLRVLAALTAQGLAGRRSDISGVNRDGRYQCPACGAPGDGHGLRVSQGSKGQPVVLHCFACQAPAEELIAALGLTWADIARPLDAVTTLDLDPDHDERPGEPGDHPHPAEATGVDDTIAAGTATETELANARRLAATFGDQIRYVVPWRKWLIWDGQRWKDDDTGQISRYAKRSPTASQQKTDHALTPRPVSPR